MENESIENGKKTFKFGFLQMLQSIVFVLTSVIVFATPHETYNKLADFLTAVFLVTGIIDLVVAIYNSKTLKNWGYVLSTGIMDVMIALLLLANPAISMVSPVIIIGFGVLFRAIINIDWSLILKFHGVANWVIFLILSILGIASAFLMVCNPIIGGLTVVIYTGICFAFTGVFQILFSLKIKELCK